MSDTVMLKVCPLLSQNEFDLVDLMPFLIEASEAFNCSRLRYASWTLG